MFNWWDKFKEWDIFFVSPDVKRAIGIEDKLPHYHIICTTYDPLIPVLRKKGASIFCLEEKIGNAAYKVNNSGALLGQSLVEEYIRQNSVKTPYIMYFKPSLKLDLLIKSKGYKPIGNNAYLNEQFENKLLFHKLILKNLPQFTIETIVGVLGELSFKRLAQKLNLPFVLQFGHGWAGKTTFFIDNEEKFRNLVKKFAYTKVKVSKKINGFTVLNNCCLYQGSVLISSPAIQISDIPLLFSKAGATCGRQWPARFLNNKQIDEIDYISHAIGKLMYKALFRGFFGLDFLVEKSTDRVYISEINARLTASASFYTYLERGLGRIPLFAYHLASFFGDTLPKTKDMSDRIVGSQIILRQDGEKPINNILPEFGVFKIGKKQPILVGKNYSPEKLGLAEFIYMSRSLDKKQNEGEELARIETKQEVLTTPKQLRSWLTNLLVLIKSSRTD